MKYYIQRTDKTDFVCDAPTVGDALIMFWTATREIPQALYRVHQGRAGHCRLYSSAVAMWKLRNELRGLLPEVIKEVSTPDEYRDFCDIAVSAAELLGY